MTDASSPPPPEYKSKEPMFAADDKKDIGIVRVTVSIPGLEVKRRWTTKNFLPTSVKEESNATIKFDPEENAFTLTVEGTGKLAGKLWALRIRKLHHPIVKDKCYYEVKDDVILIFLKKVTPTSWYPELGEGLDAYEEPDDSDQEDKQPKKLPKKKKKKKKDGDEAKKGKDDDDDDEKEEGEEDEEDEEESEDDDDDDDDEDEDQGGGDKDEKAPEPME